MDLNLKMIDLRIVRSEIRTADDDAVRKGGTLTMHSSAALLFVAAKKPDQKQNRALCNLTIEGSGKAENGDDEPKESFNMVLECQGHFVLPPSITKSEHLDNPILALNMANMMHVGLRNHLNTTLELIGISGYKLPWDISSTDSE